MRPIGPNWSCDFWTTNQILYGESDGDVHISGKSGEVTQTGENNLIGPFHFSLFEKKGNLSKILKKFPLPEYRTRGLSGKELGFTSYTTEPTIFADRF